MSKRYVVETACLQCSNGTNESKLKPWSDRHIYASSKAMANEVDTTAYCNMEPLFGTCNSPILISPSKDFNAEDMATAGIDHADKIGQLGAGVPCNGDIMKCMQWVDVKEDVLIGGYRAVMHDSWTICFGGFGIITLKDSGQSEDNPVATMQENLIEMEAIVNQFMKDNDIDPSKRDELLESILMWHGYENEDMPWDIKSNPEMRKFADYMQRNHKYLYGYFSKGMYIDDGPNGKIDLNYLMGIGRAYDGKKSKMDLMTPGLDADPAKLNAYLAACEQGPGKSGYQTLTDFLDDYNSPTYDSASKYTAFIPDDMVDRFPDADKAMKNAGYDPDKMSRKEKNAFILANPKAVASSYYGYSGYDTGYSGYAGYGMPPTSPKEKEPSPQDNVMQKILNYGEGE